MEINHRMLRTFKSVLAAGVLAITAAACSASGQSGCTQPPLQQYPAPQLISPSAGSANVPDNIGVLKISTTTQQIVGTLTLVTGSGATVAVGSATLDKSQPDPNAFLWDVKIPALAAHTGYTLQWTVSYPGACLGPAIVQSHNIAGFTTQ
jgi:hypothetical protein